MSRRLKVGDHVREVDGEAVGIIVHIMRDADVVVVNWLPSQQGIAFHPSDLVKMASRRWVTDLAGTAPSGVEQDHLHLTRLTVGHQTNEGELTAAGWPHQVR